MNQVNKQILFIIKLSYKICSLPHVQCNMVFITSKHSEIIARNMLDWRKS